MENNMENVTTVGEADANQTTSPAGTPLPSAIDAAKVVEALKPLIADEVAKATQSTKDKRFAKLEGAVTEFQNQLAKLKELQAEGWSEAQAMRLMQLEASKQTEVEASPQQLTGTQKPETAIDEQILESMGLSANDPEILSVFASNSDVATRILKSAEIAVQRKQKPNPASIVQTSSGEKSTADTHETLSAKLVELMKSPTTNMQEIKKVREQLHKLIS